MTPVCTKTGRTSAMLKANRAIDKYRAFHAKWTITMKLKSIVPYIMLMLIGKRNWIFFTDFDKTAS